MPNQEVMSPELARQIQQYEASVARWGAGKETQRMGAAYALAIAAPLWIVSYLLSSGTGPVNQGAWFAFATVCACVGALAANIAAAVLGGFIVMDRKPVKDFVVETTVSRDDD